MNRTDRLYALVEDLRAVAPQWRSAKWFAERFEVSSRTIERDLSALQQAGVPIYATPGRRWGVRDRCPAHAAALESVRGRGGGRSNGVGSRYGDAVHARGRTALQKILAVLAEVDAQGVRELASRIRLFRTCGRPEPPLGGP